MRPPTVVDLEEVEILMAVLMSLAKYECAW